MKNSLPELTPARAVTLLRFLYPVWAVVGMFSIMYVPSTLIVSSDAATTAANILSHEVLFRMGIVGSLATQLLFLVTVLVLYKLFESVNKNHAMLMVILALVSIPIAMLNSLNSIAALVVLTSDQYLKVFSPDQVHAVMMLFLNLNEQGIMIATLFWGFWLIPLGLLVYKSGYFPKILGILLLMASFGYVIDSVTHFLLPNYLVYQSILDPLVTILTLGEVVFMLWVLFRGAKFSVTINS